MKHFSKMLLSGIVALSSLSASAGTFVGDRTDFRDETIYFAMTTRFYDGDPKNNVLCWDSQNDQIRNSDPCWRGDFKGLIDKLDYIKALGFTAIWITPVVQNASGFDYHGYHAMDFSKVDVRYLSRTSQGSAEDVDFQTLIDAVHAKGMKLILDIVLNHTGNFGENYLCKLFDRSDKIRNQASVTGSLTPDYSKLGADYDNVLPGVQYARREAQLKSTADTKNLWHHYSATNWDDPTRWWGQIAGDCVDLNTENGYVSDYLVECYGKFIEMGVDGFRIDTTGHIARLTFNKVFIPQFTELGKKYASKRPGNSPFFMFGECCAIYSTTIYQGYHSLSSHFYTWKSPESLLNKWNSDPTWWETQSIPQNTEIYGNMKLCHEEDQIPFTGNSQNAKLINSRWHEPDYSEASGFSVIDFPMHHNFNNVGQVLQPTADDHYYNDATFNVVYVDSHDYGPGPSYKIRFSGGTDQWAENLSLMFTFRGIPCLYYGSEVEFQKGKTIDEGPNLPLANSGRAYFGAYLEGDVNASDFAEYTASGNVAKTLDGDLAQHIRRLNQIRAAVPALRKGQYTFDGCEAKGGWAYKRAYKDSYALVALNGGATFTGMPAGEYTDIVTGQKYSGSTITVNAPATQGQLRVLVKDWTGGKVGEDGKFIYATSPVSHGGNPTFTDPGASFWYGPDDATGSAKVVLSPAGGSFKTDTQTVTASLSDDAKSGWYKVGNQSQVNLTPGQTKTFTIGQGMSYGETVTVSWSATSTDGDTFTGEATYKKVDPNAVITIYCKAASAPNLYAWTPEPKVEPFGAWPGKQMTQTTTINGETYYYADFAGHNTINIIFNMGQSGPQSQNIEGITETTFFEYNGGTSATKLDVEEPTPGPQKPVVTANPAGGTTFNESITVTLTASGNATIHYSTDGSTPSATSTVYTRPLTFTSTTTLRTFVENEAGSNLQSFIYTKSDTPVPTPADGVYVYVDGPWSNVHTYIYNESNGSVVENNAWPGKPMTLNQNSGLWEYKVEDNLKDNCRVIINTGSNGNNRYPADGVEGMELKGKSMIFRVNGNKWEEYTSSSIADVAAGNAAAMEISVVNGQLHIIAPQAAFVTLSTLTGQSRVIAVAPGLNVIDGLKGFYIVNGKKVFVN